MASTKIAGRFELLAEIGAGGMGTVYRAIDHATGRTVAVKIHTADAADSVERFMREARVLATLAHPNVVGYVSHGVIDGLELYVVMEWLEGEDLLHRLRERGLSLAETVTLALELAEGLAYIHAQDLVHRDLKPSNVMLAASGAVKLIDFGIARSIRNDEKLTRTGTAMGSLGYMSPEQVRGERGLDGRSDVFALGCLLYECLTGVPAFFGPSWMAVQTKILVTPAIQPKALGVELPPALEALLESMLAKDRELRPTMARVIETLGALGALDDRVRRPHDAQGPATRLEVPRRDATRRDAPRWTDPTEPPCVVLVMTHPNDDVGGLVPVVAPFGATLARLADGELIARIAHIPGEPAEARAARCALALRAHLPERQISIVRNSEHKIDDATRELAANEMAIVFQRAEAAIRVDEEVATELYDEFEIVRDKTGAVLVPRR